MQDLLYAAGHIRHLCQTNSTSPSRWMSSLTWRLTLCLPSFVVPWCETITPICWSWWGHFVWTQHKMMPLSAQIGYSRRLSRAHYNLFIIHKQTALDLVKRIHGYLSQLIETAWHRPDRPANLKLHSSWLLSYYHTVTLTLLICFKTDSEMEQLLDKWKTQMNQYVLASVRNEFFTAFGSHRH